MISFNQARFTLAVGIFVLGQLWEIKQQIHSLAGCEARELINGGKSSEMELRG